MDENSKLNNIALADQSKAMMGSVIARFAILDGKITREQKESFITDLALFGDVGEWAALAVSFTVAASGIAALNKGA